MPAVQLEMSKPTVHVLCSPDAPSAAFKELLYGLEEEGSPWENDTKAGGALPLAWEAAQASRLGVGVGMDGQSIVLHFNKLDREQPLYRIPARSNAARLVKKLPLKPLDGR